MFRPENIQNLLIIVAMEVEEKALVEGVHFTPITISPKLKIHAKEYHIGKCCVRVATSGVGPVNAALTLAAISERYPLDALLLLGVGGALSPDLSPGDLVLASKVLQHDSFISSDTGTELMAGGELYLSKKPEERLNPIIETNSELRQWIMEANLSGHIHVGTVLSGSEFVGSGKRKLEIAKLDPDALLVDMEAAGIAQMARRLQIPFTVLKTVADRLDPVTSIGDDYKTFLSAAATHAGQMLKLLLNTFQR